MNSVRGGGLMWLDASRDLQLWLVDSQPALDERIRNRLAEVLSNDERERAARFASVDDQTSYVTAHALTRVMLGEVADCDPECFRFETNEFGKPRVAYPDSARTVTFNVAHTRGLVACATFSGADIGIDVEAEREPPLDVAHRYFAGPECAALDDAPAEARANLFFTLWTLKESVVKAIGTGLSTELHSFACTVSPPSVLPFGDFVDLADEWHLWHERVSPTHHMAVAVRTDRSSRPTVRVRRITTDDLLEKLGRPAR